MKRSLLFFFVVFTIQLFAQEKKIPDTVKVGIYIVSVHDIDFRQKQCSIRFWIWTRYKNADFDFAKNLEVTNAKSVSKSDQTTDTSGGEVYNLMLMTCVMNQSWLVHDYPFDQQKLEVHIENSQYDNRDFIFVADTAEHLYDPKLAIKGWEMSNVKVSTSIHSYETTFGDVTLTKPHSEYSSFDISMNIERNAWGLFFKLFLGMYVAFFITYVCIFIHADHIDSRFGLSVGALFAAVGNKYIIDSLLPESSSFTLVDSLHAFTFISIFVTITLSVFALYLKKNNQLEKANRIDKITARTMLIIYILLNIIFVGNAIIT